jgi:hypothetical protein
MLAGNHRLRYFLSALSGDIFPQTGSMTWEPLKQHLNIGVRWMFYLDCHRYLEEKCAYLDNYATHRDNNLGLHRRTQQTLLKHFLIQTKNEMASLVIQIFLIKDIAL